MARVVLVVDDDPLVLEVTAEMLFDLGCETIRASSAHEAMNKIAHDRRILALITDVNMAGGDGYQLIEHAKEVRPDLHAIACSGAAPSREGIPHLRKPFSQNELAAMMRKTIGVC